MNMARPVSNVTKNRPSIALVHRSRKCLETSHVKSRYAAVDI